MKDVTVRTTISADELNDAGLKAAGKNPDNSQSDFNGGRTFPFPEKLDELSKWEADYTKLASSKGWETKPEPMADMETGFRIRVGKEIREKARAAYAKSEAKATSEKKEAAAPAVSL